jgi:hypothetical protein
MNVTLVNESSSKYQCIIPPQVRERGDYKGAKLWRKGRLQRGKTMERIQLDNNTKLMPSLKSFKNKLKKDVLARLYN